MITARQHITRKEEVLFWEGRGLMALERKRTCDLLMCLRKSTRRGRCTCAREAKARHGREKMRRA